MLNQIRSLTSLRCSESVSDEYLFPRISSLTSLCFSKSIPSRVFASANQFTLSLHYIESVRWWLYVPAESVRWWGCAVQWISSSLTRLRCNESLFDEYLLQQISSLTSMCFSESIPSRVFASANQFTSSLRCSESVRWWLYVPAESVRWRGCVVQWISSLTSMCIIELAYWLVCATPNQFPDEVVWWSEAGRWRVCASANQFADEVLRCIKSVPRRGCVGHRISSLTSLWFSESVP